MTHDARQSAALDPSRPSVARAYDYIVGGKHHYQVDRDLADKLAAVFPRLDLLAATNRAFLTRAVRFLARDAGITQFLDVGSGLPTPGTNVHDVAQYHHPGDSRVVYVDRDPVVAANGRALLDDADAVRLVEADFTDVDGMLSHEAMTSLNWDEPIAVLHCATLHHVPDADDPWSMMGELVSRLVPGSAVVLSHTTKPDDEHAAAADQISEQLAEGGMPIAFRTPEAVRQLFGPEGTMELFEPGVVRVADWWPEGPHELTEPWGYLVHGGVARKTR